MGTSDAPSPKREPFSVLFSARTDTGRLRSHNEDNFLVDRKLRLYIVCDGLGGHEGGEIASATAVNVVRDVLLRRRAIIEGYDWGDEIHEEADVIGLLRDAVSEANHRIYERGHQTPTARAMGTTLSLLLLARDRGFIAHVGDTRVYQLRDGKLRQLTDDHSLLNEMQRGFTMSAEALEAIDGRMKNQVTRAVGVHATMACDVFVFAVAPGDRYLLASDGLHALVPAPELAAITAQPELVDVASRLVDRANECGGRDNITAICVELLAAALPGDDRRRIWPAFEATRASHFFQGLSNSELARLLETCLQIAAEPGEVLVMDEQPLAGLFLMLDGEADVVRDGEIAARLKPGDYFGEDALVLDRMSNAAVRVSDDGPALVLVYERRAFEELQRTTPTTALRIALASARALARKMGASLRDPTDTRLAFKDPGALTRPASRPMTLGIPMPLGEASGPLVRARMRSRVHTATAPGTSLASDTPPPLPGHLTGAAPTPTPTHDEES